MADDVAELIKKEKKRRKRFAKKKKKKKGTKAGKNVMSHPAHSASGYR